MRSNLRDAFENKKWGVGKPGVPRSGRGSTLEATEPVRANLPSIFERYNVKTFFDAPCGDWFWMQKVDLSGINYIGADISAEVIEDVKREHAGENRTFTHLDITSDTLPKADLMMCRDCLFHLRWPLRWRFFENFANSDIPYLLTTMHHVQRNRRIKKNGAFAPFNPRAEPFNFSDPIEQFSETGEFNADPEFLQTPKGRKQRSMGLWSRKQITDAVERRRAVQQAST